jgi:hypothetical protein
MTDYLDLDVDEGTEEFPRMVGFYYLAYERGQCYYCGPHEPGHASQHQIALIKRLMNRYRWRQWQGQQREKAAQEGALTVALEAERQAELASPRPDLWRRLGILPAFALFALVTAWAVRMAGGWRFAEGAAALMAFELLLVYVALVVRNYGAER